MATTTTAPPATPAPTGYHKTGKTLHHILVGLGIVTALGITIAAGIFGHMAWERLSASAVTRITVSKEMLTAEDIQKMFSQRDEEIKALKADLEKAKAGSKEAKAEQPAAESKVAKTEDKLPADKSAEVPAPAPKQEEATPPAPPPEEKKDVLWSDFDKTSRLTVARQIYSDKCSAAAPEEFGDKNRQIILGAASRQEVRDKLDCGDGSKEQEKVAEAPAPAAPTVSVVRDCRSLPGTVYMPQFAACVPVLRRH